MIQASLFDDPPKVVARARTHDPETSHIAAEQIERTGTAQDHRNIIEKVSPGPYLEMYGRHHVEGWTVYGNEIIGHAQREFTIQPDLF